ncbi:hypothetical protein E2C01_075771 [Portunus trituberculatus]|uniref:Uncharacterized protein n=1 Tax=Portunus trituberculatus TaxID=210409 RepID=A0A5B7IFW8_PORTR|nr:hypothetical protein [Portunus trituberculatus]
MDEWRADRPTLHLRDVILIATPLRPPWSRRGGRAGDKTGQLRPRLPRLKEEEIVYEITCPVTASGVRVLPAPCYRWLLRVTLLNHWLVTALL